LVVFAPPNNVFTSKSNGMVLAGDTFCKDLTQEGHISK
jgi:hypothetical protein